MSIRKYLITVLIILISTALSAQEGVLKQETGAAEKSSKSSRSIPETGSGIQNNEGDIVNNRSGNEELPEGFMNIKLGITMKQLEEALNENSYFDYRGKPDVDMRISRERTLIECSGFSYVKKGYFQFYNEKLIIITILIDETELDYYTFYTSLEKKYGKPHHLNPEGVYWLNSVISIALEKPLSVKYTDRKSFEEIREKSAAKTTKQKELKENFVDNF